MSVQFDSRGREILDDMPVSFSVPIQKRISTLDFHRQRLLEQREMMRQMLQEMQENNGFETFAEANDFAVEDPFDDELSQKSDFELDDDGLDGVSAVAERMYRETLEQNSRSGKENVASTETQSPPESGS